MEEDQKRMRDWLRSVGSPETILQVDLSSLLRAEDSAIWRHLQLHVMAAEMVIKIRKTILLDTLKERNIIPGSFGKFKVNSVEEMEQIDTYFEKKNKLAELRMQINRVHTVLKSSEEILVNKICKFNCLSCDVEERTMKTQLLRAKVAQVKKNVDYLSRQPEAVKLKAQSETNASIDTKIVERLACKFWTDDCDLEGIKNILESLRNSPTKIILHGLERASRSALIMLVKIFKYTDIKINNVESSLNLKQNLSTKQNLGKLQGMYLENDIKSSKNQKDADVIYLKLNEEKSVLIKAIVESMRPDGSNAEEYQSLVQELVDVMASRGLQISKVKKARQVINMETLQLKQVKENQFYLQKHFQKCQMVIKEKTDILKALAVEIITTDLIGTKSEGLHKCTAIAVKSIDKVKQYKEPPFLSLRDLMISEFKLIVKLPLRVITQSWEDQYLPEAVTQELSSLSRLSLLQSQPMCLLLYILERISRY